MAADLLRGAAVECKIDTLSRELLHVWPLCCYCPTVAPAIAAAPVSLPLAYGVCLPS